MVAVDAKTAFANMQTMNLGPIRFKLMNSEEGEGWDKETCDKVENAYRMFLALCTAYPARQIVPTKLVDKMWHYHILDTRKYSDDCSVYLGFYLHHFPYFGMRGEEDKLNLMMSGQDTKTLYADIFDFDIASLLSQTSLCGPENCEPSCTGPRNLVNNGFDWSRPTA